MTKLTFQSRSWLHKYSFEVLLLIALHFVGKILKWHFSSLVDQHTLLHKAYAVSGYIFYKGRPENECHETEVDFAMRTSLVDHLTDLLVILFLKSDDAILYTVLLQFMISIYNHWFIASQLTQSISKSTELFLPRNFDFCTLYIFHSIPCYPSFLCFLS